MQCNKHHEACEAVYELRWQEDYQLLSNMAVEGNKAGYQYTAEWLKAVDRGWLFHINDASFLFYWALEIATQSQLPDGLLDSSKDRDLRKLLVDWDS